MLKHTDGVKSSKNRCSISKLCHGKLNNLLGENVKFFKYKKPHAFANSYFRLVGDVFQSLPEFSFFVPSFQFGFHCHLNRYTRMVAYFAHLCDIAEVFGYDCDTCLGLKLHCNSEGLITTAHSLSNEIR